MLHDVRPGVEFVIHLYELLRRGGAIQGGRVERADLLEGPGEQVGVRFDCQKNG